MRTCCVYNRPFFVVVVWRFLFYFMWGPLDDACLPFASVAVAGSRGAVRVRDELACGGNSQHHPGQDAAVDRQEDH